MSDYKKRFKAANSRNSTKEDIGSLWDEQKKIEQEDKILNQEYEKTVERLNTLKKEKTKRELNSISDKISTFYNLHVIPVAKSIKVYVSRHKKQSVATILTLLLIVFGLNLAIGGSENSTGTLGVSISSSETVNSDELPTVSINDTEFNLFFPNKQAAEDFQIVKISPEVNDPAYAYLDSLDSQAVIRVTQQSLPREFDIVAATEAFQATNKIQVDENIIYHGYSENGRVQSLIFVKEEVLFSIRSPKLYPDDVWVNYYLSLDR